MSGGHVLIAGFLQQHTGQFSRLVSPLQTAAKLQLCRLCSLCPSWRYFDTSASVLGNYNILCFRHLSSIMDKLMSLLLLLDTHQGRTYLEEAKLTSATELTSVVPIHQRWSCSSGCLHLGGHLPAAGAFRKFAAANFWHGKYLWKSIQKAEEARTATETRHWMIPSCKWKT